MPITNTNVTVTCQGNGSGASPVALNSAATGADTKFSVHNPGVPTLWWGGPSVTPSTGIPLAGGATKDFTNEMGDLVYAIFATVTTTVNVAKFRS